MKKTYFIKTFRINNCLIVTAILSIMVRILLEIMNILLLSDENSNLIDYTQFIKKYVLLFENSLDKTILIVSHGATVRALHFALTSYKEDEDFLKFDVPNCAIFKYDL